MDFLKEWSFDPITSIVTIILAPLGVFLGKLILSALKTWGGYVLEGLLYWCARLVKHSIAGAVTLKHYCRLQLAGQNQYLYVPSRLDTRVHLDKVFVSLNIESQGTDRPTFTEHTLLKAGNRLIVVGDPGSGKSSLIKWLLRNACREAISHPSRAQLPILIELKNLAIPVQVASEELGPWLFKYLLGEVERSRVYQMKECFLSYSQTSGLLVLLDGLDEVSTDNYRAIEAAILGLSDELEHSGDRNTIVLTTRTQFYTQIKDFYRDRFGSTLYLKPFTPSDIYEFLTRWPFAQNSDTAVTKVYKELTDKPTLREMCRNPLILSMYVAEYGGSEASFIPETRTEFYSRVTEELLIRRRLRQKAGTTLAASKLKEQRERILGRLALKHMLDATQPANSLLWQDALLVVSETLGCPPEEAEWRFREISRETGLVTEERQEQTFRFIHLTFCEFLAAQEAVEGRESGWDYLLNTHQRFCAASEPQLRSRLVETIPFACSLSQRAKTPKALSDLAGLNDPKLLARSFLETKYYEHECWITFVGEESESLLGTPEDKWNESWLQDLYLFNVVIRDASACAKHAPKIQVPLDLGSFFQKLVDKQRASMGKLLNTYASQDAAAAFRLAEVCDIDLAAQFPSIIIENCDQRPFFDLVRSELLGGSKTDLGCSLLAEAALQSKIVSKWLSDLEAPSSVSSEVSRLPNSSHWFKRGYIARSLLSDCLTVSTAKSGSLDLPLLSHLRRIPPPGSMPWSARPVTLLTSCILFILILSTPFWREGLLPHYLDDKFAILSPIAALGAYFCFFHYFSLRVLYNNILYQFDPILTREKLLIVRLLALFAGINRAFSPSLYKAATDYFEVRKNLKNFPFYNGAPSRPPVPGADPLS